MASKSIRRQLGHSLLSSLKYTFKIYRRNSAWRPIKGYAFVSTTQIGGLSPDSRTLRFLRQEFDFRYALPLGFYNAALNLGISSRVVVSPNECYDLFTHPRGLSSVTTPYENPRTRFTSHPPTY